MRCDASKITLLEIGMYRIAQRILSQKAFSEKGHAKEFFEQLYACRRDHLQELCHTDTLLELLNERKWLYKVRKAHGLHAGTILCRESEPEGNAQVTRTPPKEPTHGNSHLVVQKGLLRRHTDDGFLDTACFQSRTHTGSDFSKKQAQLTMAPTILRMTV